LTHTLSTGVLTASGSPERSVIAPRWAAILDHAHGAIVPLLGEETVIDQLQFDCARRQTDRAQYHESQDDGGSPS